MSEPPIEVGLYVAWRWMRRRGLCRRVVRVELGVGVWIVVVVGAAMWAVLGCTRT